MIYGKIRPLLDLDLSLLLGLALISQPTFLLCESRCGHAVGATADVFVQARAPRFQPTLFLQCIGALMQSQQQHKCADVGVQLRTDS